MIASLTFDTTGMGRGLYTEAIDLHRLGLLHIERATSIEFDNDLQRWRVRDSTGFAMFSADTRQECLEWELLHLEYTAGQGGAGHTNSQPFIEYLNTVDALLDARYGITSNDVDTESIAKAQDDGWTPEECVRWLGEKYDLEPINQPAGDNHAREADSIHP